MCILLGKSHARSFMRVTYVRPAAVSIPGFFSCCFFPEVIPQRGPMNLCNERKMSVHKLRSTIKYNTYLLFFCFLRVVVCLGNDWNVFWKYYGRGMMKIYYLFNLIMYLTIIFAKTFDRMGWEIFRSIQKRWITSKIFHFDRLMMSYHLKSCVCVRGWCGTSCGTCARCALNQMKFDKRNKLRCARYNWRIEVIRFHANRSKIRI